jgi:hypothetical protein
MPTTNTSPKRGANSVPVIVRQNLAQGTINQMAVEEAQDAPMNGTILVNSYSILSISWPLFFSIWESRGEIPFKDGSLVIVQNSEFWNVTKIHYILKTFY